jgi:outer membrane protein assembly factor BamB
MGVPLKYVKAILLFGITVLATACGGQNATPVARLAPMSLDVRDANAQQSVAYQINVEHTGSADGPLHLPLKKLWQIDFGSESFVGYPIIANGIVVATAGRDLVALDEKTGKKIWSQTAPRGNGWVGPAYDNGMVFVDPKDTKGSKNPGIYAFDEKTGKKLWSSLVPKQWGFSGPPTAAYGSVYVGASGDAGTFYAYDETTGKLQWSVAVADGDDSSPVVTPSAVYVSFSCGQSLSFEPSDGKRIREFHIACREGQGSTPVLYKGLLFVEPNIFSRNNGVALDVASGKTVDHFKSKTPAFAHNVGFFVNASTLEARSIPDMDVLWSVNENSEGYYAYNAAPLVVGNTVFITTGENELVGYDVGTGKQKVLVKMPNLTYNDDGATMSFGDGELLVPDGTHLLAFSGS